ncbi:CAP domain-containing protein [Prosthecobacter sp.]|uniref:CAP domain-containing protein n=1 Tax=Prosthecobacter sp. TaxID=1965333 RepID=UPI00378500DF
MLRLLLLLLLFLAGPLGAEEPAKKPVAQEPWTTADYELHTLATFRAYPPALRVLDRATLDTGLLSAAIFFATNAEREKHKLPLFRTSRALMACAYEHSRDMATENFFSHENPHDPAKRTAWQRLEAKGLKSGELAENIAMRTSNGLTYLAFADEMVKLWMNSPGHRANILNPRLLFLGCGTHACNCAKFHIYATQNFASVAP